MEREGRFEPCLSTRSPGLEEDVGGGHVSSVIGLFFSGLRISSTDCTCSRPFWKKYQIGTLKTPGESASFVLCRAQELAEAAAHRSGYPGDRLDGTAARERGKLCGEGLCRAARLGGIPSQAGSKP